MNSYSAPRVPPKLDKAARDPPDPPQPFPVPFRPPASACGARFFSFFPPPLRKNRRFAEVHPHDAEHLRRRAMLRIRASRSLALSSMFARGMAISVGDAFPKGVSVQVPPSPPSPAPTPPPPSPFARAAQPTIAAALAPLRAASLSTTTCSLAAATLATTRSTSRRTCRSSRSPPRATC